MNDNTPLLTIGIPTRNRPRELKAALESIFEQILFPSRSSADVDVLVCDNGSDRETPELVRDYARVGMVITYHRNDTDLGFSRNVGEVIRHARGEYVLLLSDDNALAPWALEIVLGAIVRYRPGAVFLTPAPFDSELSRQLTPGPLTSTKGGTLYMSGLDWVRIRKQFFPALMSGLCFRKRDWDRAGILGFDDTICAHVLAGMRACAFEPVFLSESVAVKYRTDNSSGDNELDPLWPYALYLDLLRGAEALEPFYGVKHANTLAWTALRSLAYNVGFGLLRGRPTDVRALRRRLRWPYRGRARVLSWLCATAALALRRGRPS